MERIDWLILDELSDDYETFERIDNNISRELNGLKVVEIAVCVKELYDKGYIEILDENGFKARNIDKNMLYINANKLWCGLALKGAEYWEQNAQKYGGQVINWFEFCVVKYNHKTNTGEIYGIDLEVCKKKLSHFIVERGNNMILDKNSVTIVEIEDFYIKYYKKIKSGYKVIFRLMPNTIVPGS